MYLISLYFDEWTNKKIQLYMEQIAQKTGNMAMIDGKVPPHITLSAFDMAEEEKAIAGFTAMDPDQIPAVFLVPAYNTGKKTEPGGNAGGICCDAEPVCTVYR